MKKNRRWGGRKGLTSLSNVEAFMGACVGIAKVGTYRATLKEMPSWGVQMLVLLLERVGCGSSIVFNKSTVGFKTREGG